MTAFKHLLLSASLVMSLASQPVMAAQPPAEMLQEATDQALLELNKNHGEVRKDIAKLYVLVDELVLPHIDLQAMSKLILGKHWRTASAEQRETFMTAFTSLIKFTYTKSLKEYANQKIEYFPKKTQIRDDKYASVYSEFVSGGGQANVPVVYKLRKNKEGEWKAYDLEIENLSLVKNYRTDFDREITATSLNSLLARLDKEQAEQRKAAAE